MDPWSWLDDPDPATVQEFWAAAVARGTPLHRELPPAAERREGPGQHEVAFLWRDGTVQGVWFRINRVSDKDQRHRGLAHRVGGTDVWALRLVLPGDLVASYEVVPLPDRGSVCDPLNPRRLHTRGESSWFRLDQALDLEAWERPAPLQGAVEHHELLTPSRPVWCYLPPPTDDEVALLVLTDAEVWFDGLQVAEVLESLCTRGILPPVAILGVGNRDNADRVEALGANPAFLAEMRELAEGFIADHPELTWAGREKRVICGQSLGGLTALLAACREADFFGTALAHSPSMWWHPEGRTPADLVREETPWITGQLLAAPPRTRVQIAVGSREGRMVTHASRLAEVLRATGWVVEYAEYPGGHDFAWWRAALVDGLQEVLQA